MQPQHTLLIVTHCDIVSGVTDPELSARVYGVTVCFRDLLLKMERSRENGVGKFRTNN